MGDKGMVIKVAIAEDHEEYLTRLINGLEKYNELNLSLYTERASLEKALTTKKFDILLFNPALYDGQVSLPKATLAVLLTDESENIPESCREFCRVKKYQRISSIYRKLLDLYADVCSNISVNGGNYTSKIVFYSPIGGSGKTSIALAASTQLAMMGKSVLYVNFEDIPSDACYLPQKNTDKGMSELLAYMGTDVNFSMKLQGLVHSKMDKFYYLNHFSSPNDIYEMTSEEIEELLTLIGNTGLYDYIVIDTETALNDKKKVMFECADKIIIINNSGVIANEKIKCFMSQTHILNEYKHKMLEVHNLTWQGAMFENTGLPVIDVIEKIQNASVEKTISIIAAQNVKRLTNALMNV